MSLDPEDRNYAPGGKVPPAIMDLAARIGAAVAAAEDAGAPLTAEGKEAVMKEWRASHASERGAGAGASAHMAKHMPAAFQRGYSSGDIADFLRVSAAFVPVAEAEWGDRGGAYLERRLGAADFVRCVRRRMQGRDPLSGAPEEELFGALPSLPGAPRRGQDGFRDAWDALLIPPLRRYFYTCLEDGVPPLFSEPTPEQWRARAELARIARAHKAQRGARTLQAVGEQWAAYCALYATSREERERRTKVRDDERAARKARAFEIQRLLLKKAEAKAKARIAARSRVLFEKRKAETERLAADVRAKVKAKDDAQRAEAERMGLSFDALGAKGKAQIAAMKRADEEREAKRRGDREGKK